MRLKLRTKLLFGFIAVALIGAGMGVFGIINMKSADDRDTFLYEKTTVPLPIIGKISTDIVNMQLNFYEYMAKNDTDAREGIIQETENLNNDILKQEEAYKKTYIDSNDQIAWEKSIKIIQAFYEDVQKVNALIVDKKDDIALRQIERVSENSYKKVMDEMNSVLDANVKSAKNTSDENTKRANFTMSAMVLITVIGIVVSIFLAIWIGVYMISRPLMKITQVLDVSGAQISSASTQLSAASQEISSGATEQASSIEETTSSMEELASMVKQNVGNARESSLLAEKTQNISMDGSKQMEKMLESMTEINKSSEDIVNIVDVIDDIAFQTNMLALNASVEAARAGEVGMGFAVVADEVKSLANRSAESAKETSKIIKETIKRVEGGLDIANKLSEIFKEIVNNTNKVTTMAKEVETASKQQDQGISEVNKALMQFDEVVQTNSATAEETASSAEELLSQVESLNTVVGDLVILIKGKKDVNATEQEERQHSVHAPHQEHKSNLIPLHELTGKHKVKDESQVYVKERISFESDEEFKKAEA